MQREIIKWLQSLDLSATVHNPRRDLSNGFLVAEIISRFNRGVSMHSFDTGSALEKRLDNWRQIKKILSKMPPPTIPGSQNQAAVTVTISEALMDATAQGRDGAARELLEQLYSFFKQRHLKAPEGGSPLPHDVQIAEQPLPAYARPTAATLLREQNDSTKERFAKLTGEQDVLKLHQQNETLLETHKIQLQAQKFREPERFKPKPPEPKIKEKTDSIPRPRQKIKDARQLALKAMDDSILHAFAVRQQHEREEAFRARFDPNEDMGTALARVVARPLQQAGLIEGVEQTAATELGMDISGHHYSPGSNASFSDLGSIGINHFTSFVSQRTALPAEAKRLVWSALRGAANNIAKHAELRREELQHLLFGVDFAFSRNVARGEADADDDDVDAALDLLTDVGAAWLQINPDSALTAANMFIAPAFAEALEIAAPHMVHRYCAVAASFCNLRDVESVKSLVAALQSGVSTFATNDSVGGGGLSSLNSGGASAAVSTPRHVLIAQCVFSQCDVRLCLGLGEILEYWAVAACTAPSEAARAAGVGCVHLLCAAPTSAQKGLNLLEAHIHPALCEDASWEVRLLLLDAWGALLTTASTPPPADAAVGPQVAYQTAINVARDPMLQLFQSFETSSERVRQAALCMVAPHLAYDDSPELCDAFMTSLYGILRTTPQWLDPLSPGAACPAAGPGKARTIYPAGNIAALWKNVAVVVALLAVRERQSLFEFLQVLEPIVLRAEMASERNLWLGVAEESKQDLLDAIFNPVGGRNVHESEFAALSEIASSIVTRFYSELSGEDFEQDVLAVNPPSDDRDAYEKLRERAAEWLQAAV